MTRPLSPSTGVEVTGIDLSRPIPDAVAERLRAEMQTHLLLLFPKQQLDAEAQIRVLELFGTVGDEVGDGARHAYFSNVRSDTLPLLADHRLPFHSDFSYTAEPHRYLSLYGDQVEPPTSPTWFANRVAAAAALPPELRELAASLEVVHGRDLTVEGRAHYQRINLLDLPADASREMYPRAIHPLLGPHPTSGAPVLFVDERFTSHIDRLDRVESDRLVDCLVDRLVDEALLYVHQWRQGDLVVWDNIGLAHAREPMQKSGLRTLRRVVVGRALVEKPFGTPAQAATRY